jgi:hypothetical protein
MHKATTFEHGGKVYEVRAIPTLNGWKVRIFVEGIPANGFTYSVDSEIYQDAAMDGVPEDLVAGLMETAERDFRRGLAQELVTAEKATDDDIAAEIDKFKPRDHSHGALMLGDRPFRASVARPIRRLRCPRHDCRIAAGASLPEGYGKILRAGRWRGLDVATLRTCRRPQVALGR